MIDYKIHYMKANSKTALKKFKLNKKQIDIGKTIKINTIQSFKKISTRKMYSGEHEIELMINCESFGKKSFTLTI